MSSQLIFSGIAVASLRLAAAVLGLLVTISLSKQIGVEGLGVYTYATTLIALAAIPVSSGWATLLLRSTSTASRLGKWGKSRGIASATWKLALAVSFLGLAPSVLFLVLKPNASNTIGPEIIGLIIVTLFLDQISANRIALIRGFQKPQFAQVPELVAKPIFILAGLFLVAKLCGESPSLVQVFAILALATFANFILGRAILLQVTPTAYANAKAHSFNFDWIRLGGYLAGSSGLIVLNSSLDILILGFMLEAREIGIYRLAAQIGIFAGFGYMALNFIAAPRFSALWTNDDKEELQKYSSVLTRLAVLSAIPVPIVLCFFGERLVAMVLGPEFAAALPVMITLSMIQVLSSAFGMSQTLLVMCGEEKLVMRTTAYVVAVNAVLCISLVPYFGILGAAIGSLIASTIWKGSLSWNAWRRQGIDTSILNIWATLARRDGSNENLVLETEKIHNKPS